MEACIEATVGGRRWKLLDTYLLRLVASATLQGLLWFGGLLLAVSFVTAVQKLVGQAAGFAELLPLVIYQLPRIILLALPISILFGAVQAFTDLSRGGEVVSLMAAGASVSRLMRAPVVWGIVLAATAFWLQETVVPGAEIAKSKILSDAIVEMTSAKHFRWEDPSNGSGPLKRVIQADKFDLKTNTLIHPVIQIYTADQHVKTQIAADRATWDQATNHWKFYHAETINFNESAKSEGEDFSTRIYTDVLESDKAPAPSLIGSAGKNLREHLLHGDFERLSLPSLRQYETGVARELQTARLTHNETDEIESATLLNIVIYGINAKLATPLICLALVLIGVPLGMRPQRTGSGMSMGLSVVVLLCYYGVLTWASTLGTAGVGNPWFTAYFPVVLTTVVGITLVWKKNG